MRPIIDRGFVGERAIRNLRHYLAVILHAQNSVGRDMANGDRVESPLVKDGEYFVFAALLRHQQHALLRFREHDFVGRHAGLALRD